MPRKKVTQGPETNAEFVARLMESLRAGPIAQLFVIESIRRYAAQCAEAAPDKMNSGIISGAQWKRCAVEIQCEVLKHLGE